MFDYELTSRGPMEGDTHRIALGLRQRDAAVLETLVEQYQFRLVRFISTSYELDQALRVIFV